MLCLFLFLVQTNAVMLQPIETHIQNTDAQKKKQLLGSILSDPTKFIAEATNLDPFAVQDIITLLDELQRTSKHKEQDLVDTLEDEVSRLVETSNELSDAIEAVGVAKGAVGDAKDAVTVAEGVVTDKEGILKVKSEEHKAAELAHTGALDARDTAQAELDDLKPGLDNEQDMLINVNKMLGQLTDVLFSCEPGQGAEGGPYLGESTNDNSREQCENRCRSTVGCISFDYTTKDSSVACRLYSSSPGSRTDPGVDGRQFCIVEKWTSRDALVDCAKHSNIQFGDRFMQLGKWRIGDVDGRHLSISHKGGVTAEILREDGTLHPGPSGGWSTWDRSVGAPSGISFGDRFIQVGEWRIGDVDGAHCSISHQSGHTAQIFRADGTLHPGPRTSFSLWGRHVGAPTGISLGDGFIQLGKWRIGDMGGDHLSVAHQDGVTAQIYRNDGTQHPGPTNDWTTWGLPITCDNFEACATVVVGKSSANTKQVVLPEQFPSLSMCYEEPVNVQNEQWGDTFAMSGVESGKVSITRTDKNEGWGQNLVITCCTKA